MSANEKRIPELPVWSGPVSFEKLHGGLSNESFKASDDTGAYVVRFGRDFPFHHVFRERETAATRAAFKAGFAPELVYDEPGVMVSRFIEGKTYGGADVRGNIGQIAKTLRAFHGTMPGHVSGPAYLFWVFHTIRDYARTLEENNSPAQPRLARFRKIAADLEAAQVPLPIIYGHHDLLPANFIDDGKRLWLIDFEYAGFSTPMFDLAGVCSMAGCSEDESRLLLKLYFGHEPDDALIRAHAAMQCAALLRETMWSMVSELFLEVPGVDYAAYTQENTEALEAALAAYQQKYGEA